MTGAFFSVLTMVAAVENLSMACLGLSVKVPFLGLGMRPFGPRKRAKGKSLGMKVGVAIRTSKSILPSLIFFTIASVAMTTFLALVFR